MHSPLEVHRGNRNVEFTEVRLEMAEGACFFVQLIAPCEYLKGKEQCGEEKSVHGAIHNPQTIPLVSLSYLANYDLK